MNANEFLKPVSGAAELLGIKVYPQNLKDLGAVLERLSPTYPNSVISKLDALVRLQDTVAGTVEELDILLKVFPDWNGSVNYKLTAKTLEWQWSAKHSGVYSTISVAFPTILPLTFSVVRYCDMDDLKNHGDECPQTFEEESDEYSSDCNCEGWVEQEVEATVVDWNDATEKQIAGWLSDAVVQEVTAKTFAAKKEKTGPVDDTPFFKPLKKKRKKNVNASTKGA